MRYIKAYLNADIAGHDLEVEDNTSDDEIEKIAWEEVNGE